MWKRLKRLFRSVFGSAIESMEDPESIIKQNIRDLEDQVPKMNESIAMVRANQTLLERELEKLDRTERELSAKIKASLTSGRRDMALSFATRLEQVRRDKAHSGAQLEAAKAAYQKSLEVKRAFMREKERKTQEATRVLQANQRSEWQKKVADTMENFEVAGIDATHDEMVRKLEQKTAVDEARLELALDDIDIQGMKIEQEAEKLQANDTLRQFEIEMGLAKPKALLEAPAKTPSLPAPPRG